MSDAEITKRDEDAEINGEIERLTKLSPVQYDRERKDAARKLGIERLGTLDRVVEAARSKNDNTRGQGRPLELPEIKPWSGAVNGSELLDQIVISLRAYLVLPSGSAEPYGWYTLTSLIVSRLHRVSLSRRQKSDVERRRCWT